MDHVEPLPALLAERYRAWAGRLVDEGREAYAALALRQTPKVMIIACCDSRVMVSDMFGAEAGDYFVHRNIAALVPPPDAPGGSQGTLSTVEYAVRVLEVGHVLVLGHTGCGGVSAGHDLCRGEEGASAIAGGFVGAWLQALAPAFARVAEIPGREDRIAALERETVRFSLENLVALGFVREAARRGRLALHGGLWDIGRQRLEVLDPATRDFAPLAI